MFIRSFMVLASTSLVAAALMVQACGGDSETPTTSPVDSGAAETATVEADSGSGDAGNGAPPCDTTSDFLADIPDASLADGATTSGLCIGCLASKCPAPIEKCGDDCNCRAVVSDVLDCFSQGGDLAGCFTSSVEQPSASTQALGLSILSCVTGSCKEACAGMTVAP